MKILIKFLYWIPALGWAGLLFFISSGPIGEEIPSWISKHDKLTHGIIYGVLSALVFFALHFGHRIKLGAALLFAWLVAIAYGGSDEIHQTFVPTRVGDWYDWFADVTGATLALLLVGAATIAARVAFARPRAAAPR